MSIEMPTSQKKNLEKRNNLIIETVRSQSLKEVYTDRTVAVKGFFLFENLQMSCAYKTSRQNLHRLFIKGGEAQMAEQFFGSADLSKPIEEAIADYNKTHQIKIKEFIEA